MTSSQTNYYNFSPFSSPPYYFSPPPPPAAKPPPHSTPPPPPHKRPPQPPPPPHLNPTPPAPPHVLPPPPSPSPDNNPTVIIVVFVSSGCLFFLAFLSVALCCFLKKRKKKTVQETDIINVDEHLKVKEAIVPGPHGEAVVLLVDDDVHIQERIKNNEMVGQGNSHGKSSKGIISAIEKKKKKKKLVQETDVVNVDEHLKVKGAMVAGPHAAPALALSVEDDKHIHEEIKNNEVKEGKGKKVVQETEVVDVDVHLKAKEGVIAGPHGENAVMLLTKVDDVHIQEEIRKNEKVDEGLHGKSAQGITSSIEKGEGSSISHHHLGH